MVFFSGPTRGYFVGDQQQRHHSIRGRVLPARSGWVREWDAIFQPHGLFNLHEWDCGDVYGLRPDTFCRHDDERRGHRRIRCVSVDVPTHVDVGYAQTCVQQQGGPDTGDVANGETLKEGEGYRSRLLGLWYITFVFCILVLYCKEN